MKVFYALSDYVSHRRAGEANRRAIALAGHELTDDPARADVAVVHDEPIFLARRLAGLEKRGLRPETPLVAYCVAETDPIPEAYGPPLRLVDEVWTCSEFSRALLAREARAVHVLPHVVERPRLDEGDLARLRAEISGAVSQRSQGREPFLFYTICDGANPRKNLPALLRAFVPLGMSGQAVLVVKQYRCELDLSGIPGVVSISRDLTDAEIGALHALGECYVSAHRAEAWGLGLSEAMSFGRPVVATGYSGNMEFMRPENSFPLPYALESISEDELVRCPPFFSAGMRWAAVDEQALGRAMREVLARPELATERGGLAARDMRAYAPARIGAMADGLLRALGERGPDPERGR